MRVAKKYRLELHWDKVEYSEEDVATLKGAYFTGPVLQDTARIRDNDHLILDMTQQHLVFVPEYYQAVLRWNVVEYKEGKVILKDVTLKGKYVNSLETLRDTDWILIDCSDHEEKKHPYHLVYWSEIHKQDGEGKF
jgi:hypothetical protein